MLPRDDPRDALVARGGAGFAALPRRAHRHRVAAASGAIVAPPPDLTIGPIRGNVDTRLAKLEAGEVDALVVALCGLERLAKPGWRPKFSRSEAMLPAVGQGALAIECRVNDEALRQRSDAAARPCGRGLRHAERALLAALDGSCRTPIAGLATIAGDRLTLDALLLSPDGNAERHGGSGTVADAGDRDRARRRAAPRRRPRIRFRFRLRVSASSAG